MTATTQFDRTGAVSTWVRRVVDETGATEDQLTTHVPSTAATVATIMTRTPYCVRPGVGVDTLARLLLERGMSGVPVVEADGRPVGVVSKTDLLRHLHEKGESVATSAEEDVLARLGGGGYQVVPIDGVTVADIMTPVVFALRHDVEIVKAAALMAGESIHRLAILDDGGAVIGILSALDVVRWVAETAGYPV